MITLQNKMPITIFGASHDPEIGIIIKNFPKGIVIDFDLIRSFLCRRTAQRLGASNRHEQEKFEVRSGCRNGITTGEDLTFIIYNRDVDSKPYLAQLGIIRPSHADYVAWAKYGINAKIGGSVFSGRMTALYMILGALCTQCLSQLGIHVYSRIKSIHQIQDDAKIIDYNSLDPLFPVATPTVKAKMMQLISELTDDSVGGIVEVVIQGLPIGLGEPIFGSIEAAISEVMFAIPGIKAIEFGDGFDITRHYGSEVNDGLAYQDGKITFLSNHSGGIQGGLANGEDVIVRLAVKPTPSIAKPQPTVDVINHQNVMASIQGRHDKAFIVKAVHVAEAMAAYAIVQLIRGTQYE